MPDIMPTGDKKFRHKPTPLKMHVLTEDGANQGGSCLNCGKPLGYWYNYKYCDGCLVVPEKAVIKT